MVLKGKEAWEFHRKVAGDERERRARQLADAKSEAAGRGKEPFDLAKLEALCDTSVEGRIDPEEHRRDRYEWMYYVTHPELVTIAELGELITRTSRW